MKLAFDRVNRFDEPAMKHLICKIIRFEFCGPYTLRVFFDDGTAQVINFEPVLHGEMFGPLRDPMLFRQVRIDPEADTLVWPNGADFDPATLHDWPQYADELATRARRWQQQLAVAEPRETYRTHSPKGI